MHVGARESAFSDESAPESDWESVCRRVREGVRERVRVLCLRVRERVCESL